MKNSGTQQDRTDENGVDDDPEHDTAEYGETFILVKLVHVIRSFRLPLPDKLDISDDGGAEHQKGKDPPDDTHKVPNTLPSAVAPYALQTPIRIGGVAIPFGDVMIHLTPAFCARAPVVFH